MSNILVFSRNSFAQRQLNAHSRRVANAGGIIQDGDAIARRYELYGKLGIFPRRDYSALGGVLLNNDAGTLKVQTWFDLNNTSPVDATQVAAANQPTWSLDSDTGFNVPLFDGSNDFMSVNDLGIFNAQSAGTIVAVAKDLNRTGGDVRHDVVFISIGGSAVPVRAGIVTRDASLSEFRVVGRRTDADASAATSMGTSIDGYNYLAGEFLWSDNAIRLTINDNVRPSGTFVSGGGLVSATNSAVFNIGARDVTTNRLNGYIAELPIFRTALSAAQIQAIRDLFKRNYRTLP